MGSQKTELRINALENRVTALERRVLELEEARQEARFPEYGFKAVHVGHGRWKVMDSSGTPIGTELMGKEEAVASADEMNAALEGMDVA